mmetsp:Transcript_18901/g.30631  ORF Transcript_18901/g.30631 Transcript_18901/m.30631 type:complete len:217 (+) Transcript_18901:63-713(+)|eukprot:CAMPEP_0169081258 /NCGR_PEP_ID=MMETSP1015-20121227/10913_1 /TAXON_ID=342587 /ORGANISM="Karlodinium micrum, Strain CCMP2283" /LENGTH=216 /DNA_ID=CAMNT_0009141031 /DNA_START=48 /DNA_END=698 /DNA_ORIENTATION=+
MRWLVWNAWRSLAILSALRACIPVVAKKFKVRLEICRLEGIEGNCGNVTLQIFEQWGPRAAGRMKEIVHHKVWQNASFYRVVPGKVIEFGIPADPIEHGIHWMHARIKDDQWLGIKNSKGHISFTKEGPNSRRCDVLISLRNNSKELDHMGLMPFGVIYDGWDTLDKLNHQYKESIAVQANRIWKWGNQFLESSFPGLSYVKEAAIEDDHTAHDEL